MAVVVVVVVVEEEEPPAAAWFSEEEDEEEEAGRLDPALLKPQPCLPCAKPTAVPEQIPPPLRRAQQVLAQSASLRQAPVMNCPPWPLPMFLVPAGSGVRAGLGSVRAAEATSKKKCVS